MGAGTGTGTGGRGCWDTANGTLDLCLTEARGRRVLLFCVFLSISVYVNFIEDLAGFIPRGVTQCQ